MNVLRPLVAPPADHDGLPVPRRYFAALTIWLTTGMSVLDSAIANIALPTIATDLHSSPATAVWVINAYQLAITMLLLPLAALGDRIGHARVYRPGMALFVVGSLLCAMSHSLPMLIVGRVVQGVGAAGILCMNSALVRATYPAALLGRGIGYNALVISLSAAAGPTLAAAILAVAPWPWLFAVNVPVGLAAFAIGWRCLPNAPGHGHQPDYVAAALSAAMLGLTIYGAEHYAREGAAAGLVLLMAGLGCGAALLLWERGKPAPLFPVDLLRIPIFSLSLLTSITSFGAQMLVYVTMPFLLQKVWGHSVVESGLLMTPWPLAVAVTATVAGRLADRWPAGLLGGAGLLVLAFGLFSLARLGSHPAAVEVAWRMALCGAGFGFFQSPNTRTMVGSAPRHRAGAAGGMLATARLIGQTSGAVAVAVGFHRLGMTSGPLLLTCAAIAALLGACASVARLGVRAPAGVPGFRS